MWNQNDDYYNELQNILPRSRMSSKYFEGISPRFIRRFIGPYTFTNHTAPILSRDLYDSECYAAVKSLSQANFEFYAAKRNFSNGMRFMDDYSQLMFGRKTVKKDNIYRNEYFIEGRIFTKIGLFQIYNGTIYFYKTDDLIRYAEKRNESLYYIQYSGLPMQNDVEHIEISGDFEWLFSIVCSIKDGNLDVLNKFNEFDSTAIQQESSLK